MGNRGDPIVKPDAFVGYCPSVIGSCCHSSDEVEVYRGLCEIVDEWIENAENDGTPLPSTTAGTHPLLNTA